MNSFVIPLTILVVVCVVALAATKVSEGFAVPECPTSAIRNDIGQIVLNNGKTFGALSDYTSYLSDLYAQGAKCIPPQVVPATPDQPRGIIGGLNNNVEPPDAMNQQDATRTVLDMNSDEGTSAKTPINRLDDYEYSRIFKSESQFRNGLSPETKSDMMSKYVLDWANLPFNSQERADKEDSFTAARMEAGFREPKSGVFFSTMETPTIATPDEEATKARERSLLSQYRPTDISTHILDSETEQVAKLVGDLYATDPNYEPIVTKTGENQWEIRELKPKSKKELWEDAQTVGSAVSEGIGHPSVEISNRMADDPYFDKGGVDDRANGRFWKYEDFNKWTPGLERMFAPTFSTQEWS